MIKGDYIVMAIGAVVAFLLQVLIAPHIAVFAIVPNFMVAFCIAVTMARNGMAGPVLPFAMGLIFDLMSGSPVGAMAFSLTAMCAFMSWLHQRVGNDTLFMALAVLAIGALLTEIVYGTLILLFGYAANIVDAFVFRMLPCFIYNTIIALAVYFIIARRFNNDVALRSEIKQL